MPAKDFYHDTVVQALINDGWEITDDPLVLSYVGRELYVDLGAEKTTIAAQKDNLKIAVEIKSFLKPSPVRDLEEAVGQYGVYQSILADIAFLANTLPRCSQAFLRKYFYRKIRAVNPQKLKN
jgi:hypothetical protein